MAVPLPWSLGTWLLATPTRHRIGSLVLFGAWEIISSVLLPVTKLRGFSALVALSLLILAGTATGHSPLVLTILFELLVFIFLLRWPGI